MRVQSGYRERVLKCRTAIRASSLWSSSASASVLSTVLILIGFSFGFTAIRFLHAKQDALAVEVREAVAVPNAVPNALPGQATATPAAGAAGQPAAAAAPTPITVMNIDDKEFKAAQIELNDGKLAVKSDPPQTVALYELQRVTISHETKLAVDWIGQENRDLVQVGSVDEGNGIRDLHVRASGLAAKAIKQVAIVSRPQFRVWRQDLSNSPYWKIAIERIGLASVADLYFEPPGKDLFETELELTLTFDDNSVAKATLKATSHTGDQVKVELPPSGTTSNTNRLATVQLEGGDSLKGHISQGELDRVTVETAWQPSFSVPIAQMRGLLFDGVKPEVKTKYDERIAKPGDDDLVIVLSKDGGFADIQGRLQSINESGVKIVFEEQERSIKLERVQAIVLGAHPGTVSWKGPFQIFRLASGDQLSAQWTTLDDKTIHAKSSWGENMKLPREAVIEVTGRNTKMVNLSELTPATVEQVSYFDRIVPWVKDKSWNNKPLRLDDKTYKRGLAVHSRCFLTYDLGGDFATFRAIVGFDEEAGDRGRVVCRVMVDNQEKFAKPDLKSGEKAVSVEVSVKGAKQLRLEVDFGEDEDVGDRVIWANARLFRE